MPWPCQKPVEREKSYDVKQQGRKAVESEASFQKLKSWQSEEDRKEQTLWNAKNLEEQLSDSIKSNSSFPNMLGIRSLSKSLQNPLKTRVWKNQLQKVEQKETNEFEASMLLMVSLPEPISNPATNGRI